MYTLFKLCILCERELVKNLFPMENAKLHKSLEKDGFWQIFAWIKICKFFQKKSRSSVNAFEVLIQNIESFSGLDFLKI